MTDSSSRRVQQTMDEGDVAEAVHSNDSEFCVGTSLPYCCKLQDVAIFETVDQMIVDHADRLHVGVDDR